MAKRVKLKRTGFKKQNVKTFGFFLIFSSVVWLLVQLSREYIQTVEIPLKYVNAPMDKTIAREKPSTTEIRVEDKGFNIFYYKIFKPELVVDFEDTEVRDNQLVYVFSDNVENIEKQLNLNFEKANFINDEIRIDFQPRKEKAVKVVPRLELNYAVGYSAGERVSLQPDSIKVSGPGSVIDTLEEVNTVNLKINNINSDLKGEVQIDTSNLGMLSFHRTTVEFSQNVEKFTEGKLKVSVEVLNVPWGINLTIFPKEVIVYYQVHLDDYEKVQATDFRVVCDFQGLNEGADYLIAEVAEKPGFVTNVRLSERRIQFVIKR